MGFETVVPISLRSQIHTLDRAATEFGGGRTYHVVLIFCDEELPFFTRMHVFADYNRSYSRHLGSELGVVTVEYYGVTSIRSVSVCKGKR